MKSKAQGEGGEQGGLTADENEDEGGLGMADRVAVFELGGFAAAAVVAPSAHSGVCKSGAGEAAERVATGSTAFIEAGAQGGRRSHDARWAWAAVAA